MTRFQWAYPSGIEDPKEQWISGPQMVLCTVIMNMVYLTSETRTRVGEPRRRHQPGEERLDPVALELRLPERHGQPARELRPQEELGLVEVHVERHRHPRLVEHERPPLPGRAAAHPGRPRRPARVDPEPLARPRHAPAPVTPRPGRAPRGSIT